MRHGTTFVLCCLDGLFLLGGGEGRGGGGGGSGGGVGRDLGGLSCNLFWRVFVVYALTPGANDESWHKTHSAIFSTCMQTRRHTRATYNLYMQGCRVDCTVKALVRY